MAYSGDWIDGRKSRCDAFSDSLLLSVPGDKTGSSEFRGTEDDTAAERQ